MKISVLLPIHKTMDAPCVQSLVSMQSDLHIAGHEVMFIFANGFNAARARQGLTRTFAETTRFQADYVLWLDSDHLYYKKDFDELVKTLEDKNLQMLSASYKMRGTEETCHGITEDGKFRHFHYKDLNELPEGALVEASVLGFGFLVMKAQFLRDMWLKHGDNLFKMDIGENGTEDVAFCTQVIKDGFKVMFHPKVRVGHMELAIRI